MHCIYMIIPAHVVASPHDADVRAGGTRLPDWVDIGISENSICIYTLTIIIM